MELEREERKNISSIVKYVACIAIGLVFGYMIGINGYIRVENDNEQSVTVREQADEEVSAEPTIEKGTTTQAKAEEKDSKTCADANAVTMVSYSHDWVDYQAQISVKNNTDKNITSITGRMIYYDMSGNMLDYQDFTEHIDIDAGMTKRFQLRGYNHEEDYAYYKNKVSYSHPDNKYKVVFQLKSYTFQ